jgi:hypothetical protein
MHLSSASGLGRLPSHMVVGREAIAHHRAGKGAAQQAHQDTEAGPIAALLHLPWELSTRAGGAAGADQEIQAVFDHLMTKGLGIVSVQQGAAAAARIGMVVHHIVAALNGQHSSGPEPGWPC